MHDSSSRSAALAREERDDPNAANAKTTKPAVLSVMAHGRAVGGDAIGRRGPLVSEPDKARVLACTDAAILDRWLRNAATVASVDALFE